MSQALKQLFFLCVCVCAGCVVIPVSQAQNLDCNCIGLRCVEYCISVHPLQPLELICEKAIATCNRPLGPGEALRRVMECIASGILLPGQ